MTQHLNYNALQTTEKEAIYRQARLKRYDIQPVNLCLIRLGYHNTVEEVQGPLGVNQAGSI